MITRARSQAAALERLIEEKGGEVIVFPTIEIAAPASFAALDEAIDHINRYHWVVFTSVNGVDQFVARFEHRGVPLTRLQKLQVAAIGPETAKRLEAVGVRNVVVPEEKYQAEGLLEIFGKQSVRGKRVLIPRAAKARDILPDTLRQWGAEVDVAEAYRTVLPKIDGAVLQSRLGAGKVDVVTFTSSSTVANFVALFPGKKLKELFPESAVACIGPITENTVKDMGRRVDIVSKEYTMAGLVSAIIDFFATRERAAKNSS